MHVLIIDLCNCQTPQVDLIWKDFISAEYDGGGGRCVGGVEIIYRTVKDIQVQHYKREIYIL